MKYYFIKINDNYYGKGQNYLPLNRTKHKWQRALLFETMGYKSKQGAKKGVKSLVKRYKENDWLIYSAHITSVKIIKN